MPLDKPRPQAWTVLVVFTAMNLLNYTDRYVVPAVGESIKSSLGLSDARFGFLISAFLWVYMVFAPIFGGLAAKGSRTRVIGLGVAIWSVATALGGLAANYGQLLAARAAVGVGEAAARSMWFSLVSVQVVVLAAALALYGVNPNFAVTV